MADLEGRLSPSCIEDIEDETLDPRIQDELERLNRASEEINRLELELDDARALFRQALTDSTYSLETLAKKLGSCVEKARPYYDARHRAKEVHVETQKAAYMFERAYSMHEAAKEMVQLAEQGYMQREDSADPAWQEMLNHATMKVNEAEMDRLENEKVHLKTTQKFKEAEEYVLKLQKDLKRTINKSKPYFEMKATINQRMEDRKRTVLELEECVSGSKKSYSDALRSLEEISEAIHQKRIEMRNQAELGIRGSGVGSDSPSPPPMRGNVHVAIDGTTTHFASSCNTGNSPTTVTSAQFSVSDSSSQEFRPPSVIYSSPEKSRRVSYRQAIESRQSTLETVVEDTSVNVPRNLNQTDDVFNNSPNMILPRTISFTDTTAPEKKVSAKLKGLILTPVGAGLDPLQANLRITTRGQVARSRTEPAVPKSYPYSHNTDNQRRIVPPVASSSAKEDKKVEMDEEILSPGSDKSFRRMLKVPSMQDFDEGSISDTDSITSGTMLDDDQVQFLTMDFSKCKMNSMDEKSPTKEYRRLSLPPTLSQLETLVRQISNENDSNESEKKQILNEDDACNDTLVAENIVSPEKTVEV